MAKKKLLPRPKLYTLPTERKVILSLLAEKELKPYGMHKMWSFIRLQHMFKVTCAYLATEEVGILTAKDTDRGTLYKLKFGRSLKDFVAKELRLLAEKAESDKIDWKIKADKIEINSKDALSIYECLKLDAFRLFLKLDYFKYLETMEHRAFIIKRLNLISPLKQFVDMQKIDDLDTLKHWVAFFTEKCNVELKKSYIEKINFVNTAIIIRSAIEVFKKINSGLNPEEAYPSKSTQNMRKSLLRQLNQEDSVNNQNPAQSRL